MKLGIFTTKLVRVGVALLVSSCQLPGSSSSSSFSKGTQSSAAVLESTTSTVSNLSACKQTACVAAVTTQPGMTYVTIQVPGNGSGTSSTYSLWAAFNGSATWNMLGEVSNPSAAFQVELAGLAAGQYEFSVRSSNGSQTLSNPSPAYTVIAGSSSGGTNSPTITSFTGPSSVVYKGSITFSWATSNATSVTITGVTGTLPTTGSTSINPTAGATYVLTASNSTGQSTKSLSIPMTYPAPVISSFTAAQASVDAGTADTLSWSATGGNISLTNGATTLSSGSLSGSVSVTPTATTTYTLAVYDGQGLNPVTKTVTITALQACTFGGQTISSGQSVSAFTSQTVPFGTACSSVMQNITCTNGAFPSGSFYSTCTVSPAAACSFNGQSVANGTSVTAYQASSVPFGSSCVSQSRSCSNGTLSGTYAASSCTVGQAASCTFNGQTIANGGTVNAFTAATVPYGSSCTSVAQTISCTNGNMTVGTFYPSCSVAPAASCSFNGQTVASGSAVTAYQNSTVPYNSTCVSQSRNCVNGSLDGSYTNSSCAVAAAPPAPVISSFTATPTSIPQGSTSVLAWSLSNTTSVTIDVIGNVTGDSVQVGPNSTTTYTLTATGPGGTASQAVTLTVTAPLPTFMLQPGSSSTAAAGTPIPTFTLVGRDGYGNPAAIPDGISCGVSVGSNPSQGLIGGTYQGVLTSGGVATFNNVIFQKAGTYQLIASCAGMQPYGSNISGYFTVNGGPAASVVLGSDFPSTTVQGQASTFTIGLIDTYANPALITAYGGPQISSVQASINVTNSNGAYLESAYCMPFSQYSSTTTCTVVPGNAGVMTVQVSFGNLIPSVPGALSPLANPSPAGVTLTSNPQAIWPSGGALSGSPSMSNPFIYNGVLYAMNSNVLYVSHDQGATFQTHPVLAYSYLNGWVGSLTSPNCYDVAVYSGVVYVSCGWGMMFTSTNDGMSFTAIGGLSNPSLTPSSQLPNANIYHVFVDGNTLYVASDDGVSISTDGINFALVPTANPITSVGEYNGKIFASSPAGLYIGNAGGLSLSGVTDGAIAGAGANSAPSVDAGRVSIINGTVYVGGQYGGLFMSRDGGNTFTNPVPGTANRTGYSVSVDSMASAVSMGSGVLFNSWNQTALSSDGVNFTDQLYTNITGPVLPASSNFVCLPELNGCSTDGGHTLHAMDPLLMVGHTGVGVNKMAYSVNNGELYVATTKGLDIVLNGGLLNGSIKTSLMSADVTAVGVSGNTIYAAILLQETETQGNAILKSTDDGQTFTTIGSGVPSTTQVNDMVVQGSTVYLATQNGLYISTDGGNTFSSSSTGLTYPGLYNVFLNGNSLFVIDGARNLSLSTDSGKTFKQVSSSAYYVAFSGNTVYEATIYGLSVSTDGGNTFAQIYESPAAGLFTYVATSVYVDQNGTVYLSLQGYGTFFSKDGGKTFNPVGTIQGSIVYSDPALANVTLITEVSGTIIMGSSFGQGSYLTAMLPK